MITKDRQYRNFVPTLGTADDGKMIVEGYAVVFGQPSLVMTDEKTGIEYTEIIDSSAFDGIDVANADVVMNYDHVGKPVARTKNGTLVLSIDDIGLFIRADLSGTEVGRQLYEEIKGGYIDKMSFCFDMSKESEAINPLTHQRIVTEITALYDVAAVDQPAYDTTTIYARNAMLAEASRAASEEAHNRDVEKRKRLKILIEMKRRKM